MLRVLYYAVYIFLFLNIAFALFCFVIKVLFLCLQKYHEMDVEVIRKDGLILIREMAAEVKNMMDIKMNAVMVSTVCQFLILIRELGLKLII